MTRKTAELTRVVRSMRKALKADHGVDVPFSALRAAYLQAHGLHPHAHPALPTGPRRPAAPPEAVAAQAAPSDPVLTQRLTLHLATDDVGCLTELALDAAGEVRLPEDWTFECARLVSQRVRCPSIRRYGVPEYVGRAESFYRQHFELPATAHTRVELHDSGDDSGDECALEVALSRAELTRLMQAALDENPGLRETLAEWVGLHYRRNFDTESLEAQADWLGRMLQSLDEASAAWPGTDAGRDGDAGDARRTTDAPVFDGATELAGWLEWVYPDEDGDRAEVVVSLVDGRLRFGASAVRPENLGHPDVRVRFVLGEDDEPLIDLSGEVNRYRDETGQPVWRLRTEALARLREAVLGR